MITSNSEFKDVVGAIISLIAALLPIVSGFAVLAFIWGLAKFVSKAGDTKSHDEGKNLMKWGLIILFVMVSFMGIIRFFSQDVGFGEVTGFPVLPE